jgi:ABC-type multidrug transport system permease subunit
MNVKRFVLACLAVYISNQVLSFIVNAFLLGETYAALSHVWRPEAEMMSKMWIMFVTGAVWAVLFCYIFTRGYEGKGAMEGVRFGLLMGLFLGIPFSYESYMVYPITLGLAHAWVAVTLVISMIAGLLVALIYKPAEA